MPIYGWFTEGLDAPVLQETKALLEQLRGDANCMPPMMRTVRLGMPITNDSLLWIGPPQGHQLCRTR